MNNKLINLFAITVITGFFVVGLPSESAAQSKRGNARGKAKNPPKPKILLPVDKAERREVEIAPVAIVRESEVRQSALKIDQLVVNYLRAKQQRANGASSDSTFMRRVYLDITGTIPTLEQAEEFLASKEPNKRAILIDELLNSPGYASHFYNYWADVLRIVDKPNNNNYNRPFNDWVKQSLRDNTPWNEMVYQMMTAEGKVWDQPAVGYKLRDEGMPLDNLNNTIRIFLGTRIGCAQCHDHPFDRWTQKEFYELAAFESGVKTRDNNKILTSVSNEAKKDRERREIGQINRLVNLNRKAVVETGSRLKFPHDYAYDDAKPNQVVNPSVIFGEMPSSSRGMDNREIFATWLTSNDNPRFALTIANRLWARVIGVGLIHPVDDITEDSNPAIPELMDFLVSEMKRLDYDMKEFLRILYNSRIYQRQSTVEDPEDPTADYVVTGPLMRRMSPEQVWDSMLTLTLENPDTLLRAPDESYLRAIALDDSVNVSTLLAKVPQMQQAERDKRSVDRTMEYKKIVLRRASELPQPVPAGHFLRQFGQSDRTIISNNSTDGTVPQLLTMFNGPVTHMMLEPGSLLVEKVVARSTINERVDAIYMSVLGRNPTDAQRSIAKRVIAKYKLSGYGDLIWSLLNTREFIFVR